MTNGYEITAFDRRNASEREYVAWHGLETVLDGEMWPDDPPVSLDRTIRDLRSLPDFVEERGWLAWSATGEAVGRASIDVWHTGSNQHAAGFYIGLRPEARRQGLGTALLRRVAETAREWDRRLLLAGSWDSVPDGPPFLERLGARVGQRERISQLDLEHADREALGALIRGWRERARERAAEMVLGFWDGPYPEECLEDVAAMKAAVNLMPRGELELEDEVTTVEHLREGDRRMVARGQQRWTYYARDPATNRIAGYTEVGWHPERPWLLWQDDTAVFTEYQNRGLGRWLKAEMLDRVLAERPEVRVVRTGNAQSNAPMLNINVALGFRPYREYVEWQVERSAVDAYLDAAAGDSGS